MSDASADDLSRLGATSRTRAGMTIDPKWWKERTVEGLAKEFRVSSGPHLFIDWRFVQAGLPGWLSTDGQPYGLRAPDDGPIDAIAGRNPRTYAGPQDVPEGIRLVAQAAGKSDPFDGPPGMLVLCDDGQYHTWNDGGYFQSPDGAEWGEGEACSVDWSQCPLDGGISVGGTVCIDPTAPAGERFKAIVAAERGEGFDGFHARVREEFLRDRPDDIDPKALAPWYFHAFFGAVSADGIHWRVLPDQLLMQVSDTLNVLTYDQVLGRYVWYGRCWWHFNRRCIFRAESEDFRRWSRPEMIIWPTLDMHPSQDWYTNGKTAVPGSIDQHLMFPTLFHRATDTTSVQLFSSADGIAWSQVPGGSILEPGEMGEWDGACVFAGTGLVPLPDERMGLVFSGYPYPHKYPRNAATMTPRRALASWPRNRLCALEAAESGRFSTYPLLFSGRKLVLNLATLRAGVVRIEVTDPSGRVLPGRSWAEADPIVADAGDHTVTWRGEADIGHEDGQAVIFRFQLKAARLFAFEFK
ncbi:MAG: hypothetical protein CME15_08855 [Gemmatimonadetes bacterium]|nr:hypothetical protein [Gemmatimonadota bacterium]